MNNEKEMLVIRENLSKIKRFFAKFIFIIEFFIIGIFMTFFYKFLTTKVYEGYYSKVYLIICGITGGLALGTIIYAILKDKYKIEKIFLAIAIPIGMAYLIFLIPTYAPDENAHIYRSYEISEGILFTKTNEKNLIKSNIPSFFVENNHKTLNKYNKLNEEVKKDTNYENKVEVDNPAYSYFPTLYFPNTIMFLIGRIFNINGIIVLYLARIVNFIIFLICGYYAIKIMPFGKILLMTYLLIPMSVHQAISLSADSITNSTILLFIAYTLNLYYKEKINKKNKILYIALAALVSVQKIVYFPIVLISIILIKVKEMTKNEKIKFIIATIVVGLVVGVLWILLEPKGEATEDIYAIQNNINSVEQIFIEKLKSLLKFGALSTRYKDIFDFYYLINNTNIDKERFNQYIEQIIYNDSEMKEKNIQDVENKLKILFSNKIFIGNLKDARNNWLGIPIDEVLENILDFIQSLEKSTSYYK